MHIFCFIPTISKSSGNNRTFDNSYLYFSHTKWSQGTGNIHSNENFLKKDILDVGTSISYSFKNSFFTILQFVQVRPFFQLIFKMSLAYSVFTFSQKIMINSFFICVSFEYTTFLACLLKSNTFWSCLAIFRHT